MSPNDEADLPVPSDDCDTPPEPAALAPVSIELAEAGAGLLMLSESDEPLTPLNWPAARPFSVDALLAERYEPGTPVEEVDLGYFFSFLAEPQGWHDPTLAAAVPQWAALVAQLKQRLTDPRIYRVGRVRIDVFIVGTAADGSTAGLQTRLIET